MNDYDFWKMAFDYATLTRPSALPCHAQNPRPCPPANSGPDRRGLPRDKTHDRLGLCRHGPATLPRAAKNPGRGASLPRLENGLYMVCVALAIAVLYAAYTVTAPASLRNPIIYPDEKVYRQKINRLERHQSRHTGTA